MITYDDYIKYKTDQLLELFNQIELEIITDKEYEDRLNSLMDYTEFLSFAEHQ